MLRNTNRNVPTAHAIHDGGLREYQLGDCLGKGAFGSVYRALNMTTGETVAVKQIKLEDLPKSELRVITLEIELLKNLDHPNIVKYRGFVKSAVALNIILEYCENGSLHSISKNFGKFPENLVGIYMSQVLHGLLYLHEQGVIHRDIKGANILTTKQGLVKLADFGVATRTANFHDSSVVGTPYWMAPEVIELSGATTASDIWSLGCTVIELLDGKPPYHKLQPMHALFRIVNDDHPPLPEGASPIVRDFLMQCFQKDPNLRVSARKLLKHPWIISAKRSDAEVPQKPTEYNQAVKSVQEWNEALKSPNGGSFRKGSRPTESSPTPDRRDATLSKGVHQFSQPRVNAQVLKSPKAESNDNWDDDFEPSISPTLLRQPKLKSQDNFDGLLSAERLRPLASYRRAQEHVIHEEPDPLPNPTCRKGQVPDPLETIKPTTPKFANGDGRPESHIPKSTLANSKFPEPERTPSRLRKETRGPGHDKLLKSPPRKFVESPEDDFSDLIIDDAKLKGSLFPRKPTESEPYILFDAPLVRPTAQTTHPDRGHGSLPRPNNLSSKQSEIRRTRSSLQIQRFSENEKDEDFSDVFVKADDMPQTYDSIESSANYGTLLLSSKLSNHSWLGDDDDDADDPFAQFEEGFDEMDLEANVARDKHARVCIQVESLVGSLKTTQTDDMLEDISEQLLEILLDLPDMKGVIIVSHGMLPILELLETCRHRVITANLLKVVNTIIFGDTETQENLCFVGGIPIITNFASKRFSSEIRLEAASFIRQMFETSTLTLQMFVSAGGLKVLVEFLEEDYEEDRDLVLTGVNGIWSVFKLQGPTPKNDFCRILSRNSVLDPLSLVLSRVLDEEGQLAELCEGRIANIFFLFSQAENYVKEVIAERTVLHRVLKELRRMSPDHQITMLRFLKNLSMLSTTLDPLQNSNAIDVLIDLLRNSSSEAHSREISNQILNTIYNLCRLNKSRQEDAALNGIIPILQRIVSSKSPLKEFALPVLCDMAASGKVGRRELWRNKGLSFYISLLSDEFWQVTALDAIFTWLQEETAKVEENLLLGSFTTSIIRCFTTAKANAFENLLEPLQKLLRLSPPIAQSLAHPDLFYRVLQKLQSPKAVVRLNLLRIIRSICDASEEQGTLIKHYGLGDAIQKLAASDGAVLVRNMAAEIFKSCEQNELQGTAGSRRRQTRRSSSSNTPPGLLTAYSNPSTPTSSRTSHASGYFFEREPRPRKELPSSVPHQSTQRDENRENSTSATSYGSAMKSRLPRTSKATHRQIILSPSKGPAPSNREESPDSTQVPTPNTRRRRRVSGDKQ